MTTYVAGGTTIARSNSDSPLTYTTIPQVTTIDPVGTERSLIDVTHLASTRREYMKAIPDGMEISVVAWYDPDNATHTALRTDRDAENAVGFKITFPDSPATVVTFDAQVLSWTVTQVAIDQALQLNVTLKPTGAETWT